MITSVYGIIRWQSYRHPPVKGPILYQSPFDSYFIILQNSSNYISPSPFSSTAAIILSTSPGSTEESKHKTSFISSGDRAPLLSVSNNSNACLSL